MKRPRTLAVIGLSALASLLLALGCGVKTPPIPLELMRPQQITDLTANSAKKGVELSWSRPINYTGGRRMRDLAEFLVQRSDAGAPFHTITEVPVTDNERFQKQSRFTYLDTATQVGSTYRYQVISGTAQNFSSVPSNVVSLVRVVPPPPPNPENFVLPTPAPLP